MVRDGAPLLEGNGVGRSLVISANRRSAAMFWIYWDTAWSIVFGGIMFTTIVTHPDAEFVEIRLQSRAYPRARDL
jgi:hypothetical protein